MPARPLVPRPADAPPHATGRVYEATTGETLAWDHHGDTPEDRRHRRAWIMRWSRRWNARYERFEPTGAPTDA